MIDDLKTEDLIELKIRLEKRLSYLQEISYNIQKGMRDIAAQKLQENADIISSQSQIRVDDTTLVRHQREIKEIESSLLKFKNGEYGICEMCDGEIGIERLHAKPHARFCINCREIFERKERQKEKQ